MEVGVVLGVVHVMVVWVGHGSGMKWSVKIIEGPCTGLMRYLAPPLPLPLRRGFVWRTVMRARGNLEPKPELQPSIETQHIGIAIQ